MRPPDAYHCPDGRLAVDLGHERWLLVDGSGGIRFVAGLLATEAVLLAPVDDHTVRVYRVGDPEPDKPVALMNESDDVEVWDPSCRPELWGEYIAAFEPLVAVDVPDYHTAVKADELRRAREAAGS